MTIIKKPSQNDIENFISGASKKADAVTPPAKKTVEPDDKKQPSRQQKKKKVKKKTIKLTFYMPASMYTKWERYKAKKTLEGEKVTFQSVTLKHISDIIEKKD